MMTCRNVRYVVHDTYTILSILVDLVTDMMLTYTDRWNQEGMRKTNFRPESNPGLRHTNQHTRNWAKIPQKSLSSHSPL